MAAAAAGIGMPPGGGALPGFEPGGGLPGADQGMPMETPPEEGLETPTPEVEAGEEVLLATPGKRDEDKRWKKSDKKEDGRKVRGPRKTSYSKLGTPEAVRGSTDRSRMPGYLPISTLGKGIFTEELSNYEKQQIIQEQKILSINHETENLLRNLEKMEQKVNEA